MGGSRFFGGDGEERMDFTPNGGFGSHFGHSTPRRQKQDPAIEYPLNLTLEELYTGCTKKMKISRKVLNPDGTRTPEDKVVSIDVKPGWKAGTKITFAREGDQSVGRIAADIVFVVNEKPHSFFKREGNNLEYTARVCLRDALCGGSIPIPTIEGETLTLSLEEIVNPNTVKVLSGHGMPISKAPGRRGDLIVNFDIKFPTELAPACKELITSALPPS